MAISYRQLPYATQRGRPAHLNVRYQGSGRPSVKCLAGAPIGVTNINASQRRGILLSLSGAALLANGMLSTASWADAGSEAKALGVQIVSDQPGFGTHPARNGDLLLLHYTGIVKDSGVVFDSTLGGQMYRDGGPGVLRPAIIKLGGGPVPGVCAGLQAGLLGMTVGGKRTFLVPPDLGFKALGAAGPYGVVPPNATLQYEVELIRLSAIGPDELTKGIDRCGQGGAAQQASNCTNIDPAEFVFKLRTK